MKRLLNRLVRGYLAHFPVTEGKSRVLRLTRELITPPEPEQTVLTRHGFRLRLNLANPEHQRIYFYGEHDERYETALLKKLVRPGMACWDIGANIGYYACLLGMLTGPKGAVVAFEPARATRERLAENLALNRLGNVKVLGSAVGATEGAARIHYSRAELYEGTASLHELPGRPGSEEVELCTIDRLVERLGAPDFLKIDVEGAQLEVWSGGAAFFSAHEPLVMAELRDSKDPAVLKRLERLVRGFGFRLYSILKRGRLREAHAVTPSGPRNFLLAKRSSSYDQLLLPRVVS